MWSSIELRGITWRGGGVEDGPQHDGHRGNSDEVTTHLGGIS